jgi:signal transduction histidine kinase
MEPEAARKDIRMHCERAPEPVMVKGDAGLLRQALINVAVNAIEAMENGGELSVAVGRNANSCSIRIADTGPGIPPDQIDRIFQLYFTTRPQGSGIGLAMTSRAVQLHGGSIAVESEPGRGATFEISLPLAGGGATF